MGGGTGWIIPHFFKQGKIDRLAYIEASLKMLDLAKKNGSGISSGFIDFIHGDETSIPDRKYDCIITNFVLDCFSERRLENVMKILKVHLNEGGHWYCSEFKQNPTSYRTFWQHFILGLMRLFFKASVGLESKSLVDFDRYFHDVELTEIYSKTYFGDFICTKVWS